MKISLFAVMLLLAFAAPAFPQTGIISPTLTAVNPVSGKIGDVLIAMGTSLGQDSVAALYLTDGQNDVKVIITEQTPTSIKFKIPPSAKAGRFALMVLTKGEGAKLIEEPVKVTVEPDTGGPQT